MSDSGEEHQDAQGSAWAEKGRRRRGRFRQSVLSDSGSETCWSGVRSRSVFKRSQSVFHSRFRDRFLPTLLMQYPRYPPVKSTCRCHPIFRVLQWSPASFQPYTGNYFHNILENHLSWLMCTTIPCSCTAYPQTGVSITGSRRPLFKRSKVRNKKKCPESRS